MNDGEAPPSAEDKELPDYWYLLSEKDKTDYRGLQHVFNAATYRRNRGHRVEAFDEILETIRNFAERGDEDDWKRFLVCGVCWMDYDLAVNTRQMRLLVTKCKSSINGSLQKMGYSTNTYHSKSWKVLFDRIPVLKDKFGEIRQWTIRYKIQVRNAVGPGFAVNSPMVQRAPVAVMRTTSDTHMQWTRGPAKLRAKADVFSGGYAMDPLNP